MRVILTGAGTSAFIGECLAPYLAAKLACRVEAIATTDLVSRALSLFRAGDADAAGLVRPLRQQPGERCCARSRRSVRRRHPSPCHHLQSARARSPRKVEHIRQGQDDPAARGNPRPQLCHDLELQLHDLRGACRALRHRRHGRRGSSRMAQAVGDRHRNASGRDEGARGTRLRARGLSRQSHLQGAGARGRAQAARADRRRNDRRLRLPDGVPARAEDDRQRQDARRDLPVQRRLHAPLRPRPAGRDPARRQARRPARDLRARRRTAGRCRTRPDSRRCGTRRTSIC